jgi:putative transposase
LLQFYQVLPLFHLPDSPIEPPELQKRYWGKHFWAIGYGVWSTGNITDEMVAEYLEYRRNPSNMDRDNFILE